jgi:putative transposase
MPDYHIPLIPGKTYHVFSRAIGNERLFREPANYQFFLSRFHRHLSPVADTFSYCLLPNHFHCVLRIKDEPVIKDLFSEIKKKNSFTAERSPDFIMERVSNLLNSYTKSYNKMYNRKGSLFIDYCRRVAIEDGPQFGATIFYIHKNPVHHGYCKNMEDWHWSSYHAFLSDKPTLLCRAEVLEWFGGIKGFIAYYQQPVYLKDYLGLE